VTVSLGVSLLSNYTVTFTFTLPSDGEVLLSLHIAQPLPFYPPEVDGEEVGAGGLTQEDLDTISQGLDLDEYYGEGEVDGEVVDGEVLGGDTQTEEEEEQTSGSGS